MTGPVFAAVGVWEAERMAQLMPQTAYPATRPSRCPPTKLVALRVSEPVQVPSVEYGDTTAACAQLAGSH